jgi:hypothetical protein
MMIDGWELGVHPTDCPGKTDLFALEAVARLGLRPRLGVPMLPVEDGQALLPAVRRWWMLIGNLVEGGKNSLLYYYIIIYKYN